MKLKFKGVCYLPKKEMHLINGLVEKLASLTSISTTKEETGVKPVSSKVKFDDCLPSKKEISDSAKKAAEEIIDDTFKKYFEKNANKPNSCKINRSRKTGITWAEAQYCSVWEIWRRHHSEDQWKWNGKSAGRSTIGNLIKKAMKYIPLESLEKWDYAPGFDEPYSEHKREVILRAIEGTSTRFIDVVSSCFHDAHRIDKENERLRNSCK